MAEARTQAFLWKGEMEVLSRDVELGFCRAAQREGQLVDLHSLFLKKKFF